jgi:hypothetical protein
MQLQNIFVLLSALIMSASVIGAPVKYVNPFCIYICLVWTLNHSSISHAHSLISRDNSNTDSDAIDPSSCLSECKSVGLQENSCIQFCHADTNPGAKNNEDEDDNLTDKLEPESASLSRRSRKNCSNFCLTRGIHDMSICLSQCSNLH